MGKGRKPAQIPLPVSVLRAVHEAIADRGAGPILLNRAAARMTSASAAGRLRWLTLVIGLKHSISPHSLPHVLHRRAGVRRPAARLQYAMRHSDSRTTSRYD